MTALDTAMRGWTPSIRRRYSSVFPSLNMAVKRREQALQDYKRLQSKVEKYEEKEKTGPHHGQTAPGQGGAEFYHSLIDYFQPSFEALIRAQVVYFTEMHNIFSELTDQIDQAGLSGEQRERENEAKLSELRALSLVADD
uniref:bridging integrator 3-like isoform X2 n=1 Tax=Oncorhynchus gorbuscha TaxID=8017 RepID=UPI001EAED46A|nr:bridging integrator 3-like isoform X2 [Oncorhynchus gorbuscha]XP_046203357.1 bridging integrator 3-like isoform X2 [Oncorhynchus gorbuscha]XP_046203358.1 bridging integrator 3-like isoform X2 [Oncorhynchus gorbuscha]